MRSVVGQGHGRAGGVRGTPGLALAALLAGLLVGCGGEGEGSAQAGGASRRAASDSSGWERSRPADQVRFLSALATYAKQYEAQPNELKKSAVKRERDSELQRILPQGASLQGWVGVLHEMGTTSEGKAYVTFKLADRVWAKTWNNAISDASAHTLISAGSPLYDRLAELETGALVAFSGKLLSEASVTEKGGMIEPEWIVRLSDLWLPGAEPARDVVATHEERPRSAQGERSPAAPSRRELGKPLREAISGPAPSEEKIDCSERRRLWQKQGQPQWLIQESLAAIGCR